MSRADYVGRTLKKRHTDSHAMRSTQCRHTTGHTVVFTTARSSKETEHAMALTSHAESCHGVASSDEREFPGCRAMVAHWRNLGFSSRPIPHSTCPQSPPSLAAATPTPPQAPLQRPSSKPACVPRLASPEHVKCCIAWPTVDGSSRGRSQRRLNPNLSLFDTSRSGKPSTITRP